MFHFILFCVLSSFISVSKSQKGVIINGGHLRSLSCLGKFRTEEPCRVLGGGVMVLPERLKSIYGNQTDQVKEALNSGYLTGLSADQLSSIHPVLLLLISKFELSEIGGDELALLLKKWSDDRAITRHILSATFISTNKDLFLKKLQDISLKDETLDMIGEYLTVDLNSGKNKLLAHLPITTLLNIDNKKRNKILLLLKSRSKSERQAWHLKRRSVLRSWAKLLQENNYLRPLSSWNDADIEMMGDLLIGVLPSELNQLKNSALHDKFELFHFNFSALQVRTLFQKLFSESIGASKFTKEVFSKLEHNLNKLLPSQLQKFTSKMTNYRNSQILIGSKSSASSNQMLQYLLIEISEKIRRHPGHRTIEERLSDFGHMIYLMRPSNIKRLVPKSISFDDIMNVNSEHLTSSQVFSLINRYTEENITSDMIEKCSACLRVLPTTQIDQVLNPDTKTYLALNLPIDNLPRLIKYIYSSSLTDDSELITKILKKTSRLEILKNVSVRSISNHIEYLIKFFKTFSPDHPALLNLPDNLALAMYRSIKNSRLHSSVEADELLNTLIHGVTCYEVNELPESDFIVLISKYRRHMLLRNKEFPKDLQQCCSDKLVEYLKFKSFFTQQFINESQVNLLTPVEIEAVGGWILVKLSLDDFLKSEFKTEIIKQIGSLSISELLVASDLSHLRNLTNIFLQDKKSETIMLEDAYALGNLIMLSGVDVINRLDPGTLRTLLEMDVLDRRLCSVAAERTAWTQLILKAFGSPSSWLPEDLELLGDMMMSLTESSLDEISDDAWITMADILDSKYLEPVQWHEHARFYKVCQHKLPKSENENYLKSIQTLIRYYLMAAQKQVNTVKTAKQIQSSFEDLTVVDVQLSNNYVSMKASHADSGRSNHHWSSVTESFDDNASHIESGSSSDHWSSVTESVDDNASHAESGRSNDQYSTSENEDDSNEKYEIEDSWNNGSSEEEEEATSLNSEVYTTEETNYDMEDKDLSHNTILNEDQSDSISTTLSSDTDVFTHYSHYVNDKIGRNDFQNGENTPFNDNGIYSSTKKTQESTNLDNIAHESDVNSVWITKPVTNNDSALQSSKSEMNYHSGNSGLNGVDNSISNSDENDTTESIQGNETLDENESGSDEADNLCDNSEGCSAKITLSLLQKNVMLPSPTRDEELVDPSNSKLLIHDEEKSMIGKFIEKIISPGDEDRKETSSERPLSLIENLDDEKARSKRSLRIASSELEISCDAVRTVGIPASLVLTVDMVEKMTDDDITDCTELFGLMDLPVDVRNVIWSRSDKSDYHLKGGLLEVVTEFDLNESTENLSDPWVLENIYTLSSYNSNPIVAHRVMNNFVSEHNQLKPEEVAAFGQMLCHLPDLKERIDPSYIKTITRLGKTLPCHVDCLSSLASLAQDSKAFGDSSEWSSTDVSDLGIIIAGLSEENWNKLLRNNNSVLFGLRENAGACLTESHIKYISERDAEMIPYWTRVRMVQHFKFLTPEQKHSWLLQPSIKLIKLKNTYFSSNSIVNCISTSLISFLLIFNIYFIL